MTGTRGSSRALRFTCVVKQLVPYRIPFFHLLATLPGWDVVFLLDRPVAAQDKELLREFPLRSRVIRPNVKLPSRRFTQSRFPRYFPLGLLFMLLRERPHVILLPEYSLQSMICLLYALVFRCRTLMWCSLTGLDERVSFSGQQLLRSVMRRCVSAFVCYSVHARDYLLAKGVPAEKCFIAENCSDVEFFAKSYERKPAVSPARPVMIAYAGALSAAKGVGHLFEALARITAKPWELAIAGSGPLDAELRAMALALRGHRVVFHGPLSREALIPFYRKADILVLPTQSDVWAHVIDEAMAMGCVAVSSRQAIAALEHIEDGTNGFLFPYGDTGRLAEVLGGIIDDPCSIREVGDRARDAMRSHTERQTLAGFEEALRYIMSNAAGRTRRLALPL